MPIGKAGVLWASLAVNGRDHHRVAEETDGTTDEPGVKEVVDYFFGV
ncbi:MAG: hypothetical protein ACYTFG_07675 [Planctomycetota bacterium]|jgi:hypothetical protein